MKNFRELLASDHVYVFDGAMGTRLYDKGIYINRSYDELNLTNADLHFSSSTPVVSIGKPGTDEYRDCWILWDKSSGQYSCISYSKPLQTESKPVA